jgi:hypothetical protein
MPGSVPGRSREASLPGATRRLGKISSMLRYVTAVFGVVNISAGPGTPDLES